MGPGGRVGGGPRGGVGGVLWGGGRVWQRIMWRVIRRPWGGVRRLVGVWQLHRHHLYAIAGKLYRSCDAGSSAGTSDGTSDGTSAGTSAGTSDRTKCRYYGDAS